MSDLIKTLRSSSTGDDVYPNIKEDNIPSGAVTSAKIGTSAVTTGKINDGAVTANKINDGAVDYNKLALALKNLIDGKASNYDLSIVQSALNTHVANTSNPHSVTKAQVGLGNVDNTSDANKPVSTATQGALDLKADKSTTYTKTEVDTALSGKASLTGGNTFNGNQSFNNDIELENEGNITFTDSGYGVDNLDELVGNLQTSINAKSNKLYLHRISLDIELSGDYYFVMIMWINSSNSAIDTITKLSAISFPYFYPIYSADGDGLGNGMIPHVFSGIDGDNNSIEIFYYEHLNSNIHYTSKVFTIDSVNDSVSEI